MHCILEGPNSKIGNLYLGNINAANDSKYLHDHQVGAVLSVIDTSDIKLDSSITKMVNLYHLKKKKVDNGRRSREF